MRLSPELAFSNAVTVYLGERFGVGIWGRARIWGERFLNYWVWQHKKGKFSIPVGFIAGICIPKIPAQNPLKTHVISEITERGILKFLMARDSFHVLLFIPLHFIFSLLITQHCSLSHSLFSIFFFSLYQIWLNLFSVFSFQVRFFFLSLLFVFLSYAYPSISHSFSLEI